ncbi:MAG TPA: response regulator transcription factor [Bryobacteraceae bacterium]|nr:response regulator transcription factor [Bryobacteraceae bacterium]
MKRKVLVVEDDRSLAQILCHNLAYEGFEVVAANDGPAALKLAEAHKPDLVLLDLMLPGLDGIEVCRTLAQEPVRTGLIIITARNQKQDKLQAFEFGADDYVTKPFTLDELLARVHAVLRRVRPTAQSLILGDLTIDFVHYSASRGGRPIVFTYRELEVLHYMSERLGQVVTRNELLQRVWGLHNVPSTRCVDNLIARLRLKIEPNPHQPTYLRTAHGDGYRLTPA